MRKGEIARLTWEAFDREAWTITLHAEDAKTRKGRVLGLEGPLWERAPNQGRRLDSTLIFHRDSQPVTEFRKAWSTATKKAGLFGALFHDLRSHAGFRIMPGGIADQPGMSGSLAA
jgi:integrase